MQDIQTIIMPWVEAVIGWLLAFWVQLGNQFIDRDNITGLSDGFLVEAIFILIAYALGRAAQRDSDRKRAQHAFADALLRDFKELHSLSNAGRHKRMEIRERAIDRLQDNIQYVLSQNSFPKHVIQKIVSYQKNINTYKDEYLAGRHIHENEKDLWKEMAKDFCILMKALTSSAYTKIRYEVDGLMHLKEDPTNEAIAA